jgi:transposase
MPNQRISDDLKDAVLRMVNDGMPTHRITHLANISASTITRTKRCFRLTGSVTKAQAIGRGRPRKLVYNDTHYLLRLSRHNPIHFLDEYSKHLSDHQYLGVSLTTIHRTFERAGISVKRVQKLAAERDPILRSDYKRRIAQYPSSYLIPIDEVSKDDRTYSRLYGRSKIGTQVEKQCPFVRKWRFSLVAALALDEGIIAASVVEGSFHHDTFYAFLRDDVVRSIWFIMSNCS